MIEDAPLLTKTVKINQSEGIPGSGIPERTFVKNSYKRSHTSLPSPPLLFIGFFTSHRSPLSERLEQAIIIAVLATYLLAIIRFQVSYGSGTPCCSEMCNLSAVILPVITSQRYPFLTTSVQTRCSALILRLIKFQRYPTQGYEIVCFHFRLDDIKLKTQTLEMIFCNMEAFESKMPLIFLK